MACALDEGKITEFFRNKSVLITGSTGFLGKILVEKILRVQPDVGKIYLPVRAADAVAAKRRVETEEKHGDGFDAFIEEKIIPLAGDVMCEGFGVNKDILRELRVTEELNVIVNGAATTNFYERYDVALDVNVAGVRHMCEFAKMCPNLEVLLHVSTAYVAGERQGLVQERPFRAGETLKEGTHLDIDTEVKLAKDVKKQLAADGVLSPKDERKAMKELGLTRARHFGWPNTYVFTKSMGEMTLGHMLGGVGDVPVVIVRPSIITSVQSDPLPGWIDGTRTIDAILIGYAKQNLPCFLADLDLTMDVIPVDMVVNAMMAATVAHATIFSEPKKSQQQLLQPPKPQTPPSVYHVSSSLRHPAPYAVLYRTGIRYFEQNPRTGPDGRAVRTRKVRFLSSIASFHLFMVFKYRLPLELLHLLSILCCGLFGLAALYHDLARKYRFVMQLVDLYGPFSLFKGCFDDVNLNKLRLAMASARNGGASVGPGLFNLDPKTIDWDEYFYRVHIPGVMKYVLK